MGEGVGGCESGELGVLGVGEVRRPVFKCESHLLSSTVVIRWFRYLYPRYIPDCVRMATTQNVS